MKQLDNFIIDKFKKNNSFYIEASAGTGKTWTVMQIVKELIKSGVGLDKILIVTYTEKAVGELKDRVRKELKEAINKISKSDVANDENLAKERLKEALKIVANAPIFTIHSFCQKTLLEASFLALIPGSLDMTNEANVDGLLQEKLRDEFVNEVSEDNILDILKNNSGIINVIKSVIDKYYLTKDGAENPEIISLAKYSQDIDNKGQLTVKNYIYNKIIGIYKQWLLSKENDNKQTFNDMIRGMHEAICGNKNLSKNLFVTYLRSKYTYAIIDEFQDTNQRQWDIFRTIFCDDKHNSSSTKHSLIVVGDPKQSIYSFQGADVNVYSRAKLNDFNNKGFRLSCNYRSTNNIIEFCNYLIGGKDKDKFFDNEKGGDFDFTPSNVPPRTDDQKLDANYFSYNPDTKKIEYNGKPVWLIKNEINSDKFVNEWEFADFAVNAILDCCSKINVNGDTLTKLQIFDKEKKGKRRNVNYGDFTILYKQRSELQPIIAALKKKKIPFMKYKDLGLFDGKECVDWIAILQAINADDFAEYKRKILNKTLFTNFFSVPITEIENPDFDYPNNPKRRIIQDWKNLAQSSNWLALVEKIFEDTKIEEKLREEKNYDSLTRYRQIGAYIADFLFKGNSTLSDCIEHLEALCGGESGEETQGDDGNIVELGTDSKCVKVMTIHASKGLEFPVVISVAGFKGKNFNTTHCWQGYISGKGNFIDILDPKEFEKSEFYKTRKDIEPTLNNDEFCTKYCIKNVRGSEEDAEFKRLFYVAYTRASSLLVLPYYDYINKDSRRKKQYYNFLATRFAEMVNPDADNKTWVDEYVWCRNYDELDDINEQLDNLSEGNFANQKQDSEAEEIRLKRLEIVKSAAKDLVTFKQSYSSLSKGKADIYLVDKQDNNKSELGDEFESISNDFVVINELLDLNSTQAEKNSNLSLAGAYFGSALHEIFEKANFEDFKLQNTPMDEEKIEENSRLIKDILLRYGLINNNTLDDISLKNKKIVEDMIYASMNAALPKIRGSKGATNPKDILHLADISESDRLAETEFLFNAVKGKWYCNGFMDLVFRYKDGDDYRYCILDYKSDKLESPSDYVDMAKLKAKVDEEYSIQRVLYSYCLIKWLAAVYSMDDLEAVFAKYFGGIYYLLARETEAEKQNGIYAHTWGSFADLEKAYKNISHLRNVEEDE